MQTLESFASAQAAMAEPISHNSYQLAQQIAARLETRSGQERGASPDVAVSVYSPSTDGLNHQLRQQLLGLLTRSSSLVHGQNRGAPMLYEASHPHVVGASPHGIPYGSQGVETSNEIYLRQVSRMLRPLETEPQQGREHQVANKNSNKKVNAKLPRPRNLKRREPDDLQTNDRQNLSGRRFALFRRPFLTGAIATGAALLAVMALWQGPYGTSSALNSHLVVKSGEEKLMNDRLAANDASKPVPEPQPDGNAARPPTIPTPPPQVAVPDNAPANFGPVDPSPPPTGTVMTSQAMALAPATSSQQSVADGTAQEPQPNNSAAAIVVNPPPAPSTQLVGTTAQNEAASQTASPSRQAAKAKVASPSEKKPTQQSGLSASTPVSDTKVAPPKQKVVNAKPAPSSSATQTGAASSPFVPVLLTLKDQTSALQVFRDLQKRHPALATKTAELRSIVGPDQQNWYQVLAVPSGTQAEATELCRKLGPEGEALDCKVAAY